VSKNGGNEHVEKIRRIWTPERELIELAVDDAPQTELDSIVRDFLHRHVQQHGPVRLVLERDGEQVLNYGVLRWEIAGVPGYREVSIWIEEATDG